jgi:LuxR family maltose regulon positive regulatory protein
VDRVRPGLGRGTLQRLRVSGSPIEDAVDELMNGITSLRGRLILVLDDVHAVTDEECLSSIDRGLRHLPGNARIIVSTRVDPPLGLERLRAASQLVEVRASELAFSADEAHELLVVRGGIPLGAEQIDALIERTEGWPAALVLAGLWLRAVDDPASAVRAFGGDQRFVADYLTSEVLASLDEDRRSFLQGAAVLGEFTADLCEAVLDRADAATELAELERANLFVSRLGGGKWFRMHSLLAEYAQAQLASLDPAAAPRIHRQAAEWLRSRGLPVEAVAHAAAAGDHELVAAILVERHLPLIRTGSGRTLLRWVRTLPDDHVVEHPELAVAAATATVLVGGSTLEQRRFLRLADRALGDRPGRPND